MASKAAVSGVAAALGVAALATFQALTPSCPATAACLSWTAPTQYTDGSAIPAGKVITYTVYRGVAANAVNERIGTTTALNMVVNNNRRTTETQFFNVTASVDAVESERSGTASKLVRAPGPTEGRIEGPTDGAIE